MSAPVSLPPSASDFRINLAGAVVFLAALAALTALPVPLAVAMLAATGVAYASIIAMEVMFLRVHQRPDTGWLKIPQPRVPRRIFDKLFGLAFILCAVGFAYAWLPLYAHNDYASFISSLPWLLGGGFIVGVVYILWSDGRVEEQPGGLAEFGAMLTGHVSLSILQRQADFLLMLVLRAFFIPLMFSSLLNYGGIIASGHMPDPVLRRLPPEAAGLPLLHVLFIAYYLFACLDVMFAFIGYAGTFRALDSHVRSVFRSPLAWFVCIVCYAPFFDVVFGFFVMKAFFGNPQWYVWLDANAMLFYVWGALAIVFMCLESFCALAFGVRFSNLSYRGLITAGPYRYTKHPQYIAKLLHRFFVYMPFLSLFGWRGVVANCAGFLILAILFWLRAKTEEEHLMQYPEYRQYAAYIEQHGIFRWLKLR